MSKELTIAVIGLGLIGASILKGLKNKNYKLIGVSRSHETIQKALQEKIIQHGSTNMDIIKDSDIVFICTPINKTVYTLTQAINTVKPQTIITDVASIKGFIIDFVNTSHDSVNFIGGHPMAGTENKGIDSSLENLFDGAKWVLTPSKWTNESDLNKLKKIIENLNAEIIISDPHEHDKAVSLISHMPLLLSQGLFGLVKNFPDEKIKELALKLASSGFRDTTRLAATNTELAGDLLFENKTNVIESIRELKEYLSSLEILISENEENFIKLAGELAEQRKNMYSSEGKNIYTN